MQINSVTLNGFQASLVKVEAQAAQDIVFDGDKSKTARAERSVRVRTALATLPCLEQSEGYRVILPEADIGVDGAAALAVAGLQGRVCAEPLKNVFVIGELSLTGKLRPVRGTITRLRALKEDQVAIISAEVADGVVPADVKCQVLLASTLEEIVQAYKPASIFRRQSTLPVACPKPYSKSHYLINESELSADSRKLANDIVSGSLGNCVIVQPRLAGHAKKGIKDRVMAARLVSQKLSSTHAEHDRAQELRDLAGLPPLAGTCRAFRAPHHSVSDVSMVGTDTRPGEIALAYDGVLFLDQAENFKKSVLESLARAIRDGHTPNGLECNIRRVILGVDDETRCEELASIFSYPHIVRE